MSSKVDPNIIAGFVREVESYLPKLVSSLEEFQADPERAENLEEAYRMVHCIRGAGSTIGLYALSQIAQYQEDTLELLLNGQLSWSAEAARVLASATASIDEYLHAMASDRQPDRAALAELIHGFRSLRNLPDDPSEVDRILGPAAVSESAKPESPAAAPPAAVPSMALQTLDEPTADDELWAAFEEEATGHFEILATNLAALGSSDDPEILKAIRRSVHQLKGASGVVGLRNTSKLNAGMQKVLDRVFEGEAAFSRDLLPLFQNTFETVLEAVGGRGTGANLRDRCDALLSEYDQILATTPAPAPAVQAEKPLSGPIDRVEAGDDLWDAFHQEAEEHLQAVAELLRAANGQAPQTESLQALRRSVHTLKGACGVVGMRLTSSIAHRMEDMLDALYEGRLSYTAEVTPLLFATFDLLTDSIGARGLSSEVQPTVKQLFDRYDSILKNLTDEPRETEKAEEPKSAPPDQQAPISDERKSSQFVRAPLERVDELVRLVSELVIHRSRFEQYLSAYVHEVSDLHLSIERLNRISRRLQSDYEAAALQEANRRLAFTAVGGRPFGGEEWDALEFDRYTEFHLLSRDLAETTGDVGNAGTRLNDLIADFDSYLNRLSQLTGEVEDRLMRLRMLPLRNIGARLHRTVRVTAERRYKQVDLVIEGESVELDKTVLEEMAGPLDHLLRNAVDHGIEPAQVRRKQGKPERGTITLRAFHEGTQVVLQIRDDGQGLDPERLRESAVRMGYANEEEAASLSEQELYSLIFTPGFSTAREVSEVSGRGVGLDVVKSTVSKMKGTLSISSERRQGTTFIIRLPMTLALTRVVLVKSGNETYAIPLSAIAQILRVEPEQLERVGRKPVLRLGGKIVPTMHLAEVVGQQLPPDANLTRLKAVVLNVGEQRLALMVDQVLEAREVVVKTLSNMLGRVHGVTGATLMGDGSVVLILNPNDMLHQQHTMAPHVRLRAQSSTPKTSAESFEVLIVDDSPSVRRVLTTLIRNAGWTPHSAKDGLEALEMIHAGAARPEIILLDIEMPRMDGYELTAAVRAMPHHRRTPIVMLTSRAGDKHRKRAFEVGATEYMVKPYQDEELLSTVRRTVAQARSLVRH